MAYTEQDLEAVRQAIIDLASGNRLVRVQIGDQVTQYAEVDLPKLEALEARIESAVAAAQGRRRPRVFRAVHRKGL